MFCRILAVALLSCLIAPKSGPQALQQPSNPAKPAPSSAVAGNVNLVRTSEEDWTKLAVDRKVLASPLSGAVLGTDEGPTYTRELLRFEWRAGDPVDIWLIKPRSVAKPRVVLYLYGFPGDLDRFQDPRWDAVATSNGLAAVGFVSALTGERFRSRPLKEWFVSELQESLMTTTHDVQLILDYLDTRSDLDTTKIGMFGQGSGATIAILAAAADKRITAIDLLNPWGDWPDWLERSAWIPEKERSDYLTPEFLQKAAVAEPVTYLPQLKGRDLHLQQIMDDPETPSQARDKIAAATPPGDLEQYPDKNAHQAAWMKSGPTKWLAEHLGGEIPPSTIGSTKQQP